MVRGIDAARAFDTILIQTNGGPQSASETMSLLIYRTMIRFGDPGLASAMGTIYLLAMLAVAVRRRHHHLAARKGHLMSTIQRPTIPARQIAKAPSPAGGGRRRRGVNREGLEAGKRSTRTILWILLAASLVLYGFPFLYLLFTSFKTPIDTIAVPPTILPKEWTLENYVNALGRSGVPASFINSVQTAVISTLLSLVLAVPAAYGITRYKTPSGRVFIMAALVTRMVPPVAIGIPLASMMASVGLADTPIALSIAHTTISLPLSIWLMSSFFEAVPA